MIYCTASARCGSKQATCVSVSTLGVGVPLGGHSEPVNVNKRGCKLNFECCGVPLGVSCSVWSLGVGPQRLRECGRVRMSNLRLPNLRYIALAAAYVRWECKGVSPPTQQCAGHEPSLRFACWSLTLWLGRSLKWTWTGVCHWVRTRILSGMLHVHIMGTPCRRRTSVRVRNMHAGPPPRIHISFCQS